MIKIVFFDIDGTIYLNAKGKIIDSTILALRKLRNNGIKICTCTSRSYDEMIKLPSFIFEEMDGIVCACGSQMYINNKLVKYFPIKQETVNKIMKIFDDKKIIYRYSGINHVNYLSKRSFIIDRVFNSLYKMVPDEKKYEGEQLTHILYYCDDQNVNNQIKSCLDKETFVEIKTAKEIAAEGIDKANGMKIFAKEFFNINEDEIMSFGDGDNDVKMLKEASIGVAMGNASDDCKKVADYVTDSIEKDGIYNALKHFELID